MGNQAPPPIAGGARAAGQPVIRPWPPLSRRDDVDDPATTLGAELDIAADQGEEGVVTTAAHAAAGVEVRAALPDDDLARVDELTAVALHTEPLGVRVPTVLGRGCALLVCHVESFDAFVGVRSAHALMSVTLTWVYFLR
jgi:hypothetical protein